MRKRTRVGRVSSSRTDNQRASGQHSGARDVRAIGLARLQRARRGLLEGELESIDGEAAPPKESEGGTDL